MLESFHINLGISQKFLRVFISNGSSFRTFVFVGYNWIFEHVDDKIFYTFFIILG